MIFLKNLKKRISFKKGLSLVEVIFYAAFLTIILSLTTSFLHQVANFRISNQITSSLFQNSQLAIRKITQDIRLAESVTIPTDDNFINSLIMEAEGGTVTYQINGEVLTRNGVELTDDKVEVFLDPPNRGFRRIGDSIQIKIKFKAVLKPFGQNHKEQEYQTTVFIGD